MKKTLTELAIALDSAARAMSTHPRDWSSDGRDAWLYGVVCGWDAASLRELKAQFRWQDKDVERLKRYGKAVEALVRKYNPDHKI